MELLFKIGNQSFNKFLVTDFLKLWETKWFDINLLNKY